MPLSSIVGLVSRGRLWDIFADFHNKGAFQKTLNVTFIGLIPKVVGTDDIKFFRLIVWV